jgi:hypothetical protein
MSLRSCEIFDQTVALCVFVSVVMFSIIKSKHSQSLRSEYKEYTGACHCKSVTFTVIAPKHLTVWDCHCSKCAMKKNWHFIVPSSNFKLLTGKLLYVSPCIQVMTT